MQGISEGFRVMGRSIQFFFKHPLTLVPVLLVWAIYIYAYIEILSVMNFDTITAPQALGYLFIFTVLFTFTVSVVSLILLELVEQWERYQKMNIFIALKDALIRDLYRTIPIIIVWSIVKYLLTLVSLAISSAESKNRKNKHYFSASRNRRQRRWIERLQTGIRMAVMLTLPAIAWEEEGPIAAGQKGMDVYKSHFAEMVTGTFLSRALSIVTFTPVVLFLIIFGKSMNTMPIEVLYGIGIYTGIAWSFGIMVEQLFTAELYLWYHKYENEYVIALTNKQKPPKLSEVAKPSFLDTVNDMDMRTSLDKQLSDEYDLSADF